MISKYFQVNIKAILQILWMPPDQLAIGDSSSMSLVSLPKLHAGLGSAVGYNERISALRLGGNEFDPWPQHTKVDKK